MRRAVVAVSAALMSVVAMPAGATPGRDLGTDRLTAGHCMTASNATPAPRLRSSSHRFDLRLYPNRLELGNYIEVEPHKPVIGHSVWQQGARRAKGKRAALCVHRNGNVTLRVDGKRTWSTRTSGRGNVLRVLDGGSLVVRSARGRTVWSSRTTAAYLRTGDMLRSGQTLVNRLTSDTRPARLRMTRDGDLQLLLGTKVRWHSRTHAQGAGMVLTTQGALTVRTTTGRVVWTTRAYGTDTFLTLTPGGTVSLSTLREWYQWLRPGR